MRGSSDRFFESAKRLVDDVILGKKVVVVSYVVILETIHALRRRITENYKSERSPDDTHHAQIRNTIDRIIQVFLSSVCNLARKGHVVLIDPSVSMTDHHALILHKMTQYFGHIRAGRPNRTPEYRYMGLGHVDFEHAFLAKLYNVRTFYSSDLSFEHLDGDDDFKDMRFEIMR